MQKLTLVLAAAALAAGCANRTNRSTPALPPQSPVRTGAPTTVASLSPTISPTVTPPPATRPAAASSGRVVEIITKPRLATQPTTGAAAVAAQRTGNAAAGSVSVPTPKLTLDQFNKVDAAVSCAPLARLLAMKLNNIPYVGFAGYGALDFSPKLPEGTDPDAMTNDVLTREPSGTAGAIKRLIAGEVDLVLVPRLPDAGEQAAASAKKLRLRSDLVATEALVFSVNAANPVNNLPREQLARIFTGQAKLWKDLGEPVPPTSPVAAEPITVAYRARGTGSEELLRQLLLQNKPMPELPVSRALSSSKLVLDASVEDSQTIGFSVFAYASNMKRDGRVKMLAVDGVVPEPNRVATGEYPLTTPIYVLTRADLGADNELYKLRQWLSSMDGQKTLAEAGYMPVSSEAWTAVRLMGN